MTRRLIGMGLLATVFLTLPALDVHAQNKKKAANAGPVIDSGKLNAGEYAGTLRSAPGSDRRFSIEVEVPKAAGGGGGNNNAGNLARMQMQMQQAQRQLATARTPQQRQQAMNRLMQLQRQLAQQAARANQGGGAGRVTMVKQEVEFQASDSVKVRTLHTPDQFDEKGNLKKYNAKEIAELKGKDKNLPGFESSLEKLSPGQKVRLVLAAARQNPANKDKEGDAGLNEKRMQVRLIVILEEGSGETAPPRKAKKK